MRVSVRGKPNAGQSQSDEFSTTRQVDHAGLHTVRDAQILRSSLQQQITAMLHSAVNAAHPTSDRYLPSAYTVLRNLTEAARWSYRGPVAQQD